MTKKYVIISPCRDEEQYMRRTLDSVVKQSLLPDKWLIVDDGSTDNTPEILAEYEKNYEFIEVITRENRGFRKVGPGVVDAFYEGYRRIDADQYTYICKLDLDLDLPEKYFEILVTKMRENPRIGTCSGKPYNQIEDKLVSEKRGDEMSVGMTKLYRLTAFKQVGGLVREVMWDAIDCHRMRQLGWIACSWDEPELRFIHLRMMGSSQDSIYVGRMRHGFGQYYMGTDIVYMLATSIYRMIHSPYILGGLAMFYGYLASLVKREKQLQDRDLIQFIRRFQWACLVKGKSKATKEFNDKQQQFWSTDREDMLMPILPPSESK